MYLAEENWRKRGIKANIQYRSSLPVIFGVKKYADALWKVVEERGIEVNNRSHLVEVRPDSREAVFENLDDPSKRETVPYEMLHVSPPMGSPDVLKAILFTNLLSIRNSIMIFSCRMRPSWSMRPGF